MQHVTRPGKRRTGQERESRITLRARDGTLAVEAAFVFPIVVILIFGLIVGGLTVFRKQLVVAQAREAARWASTRGSGWAEATGKPSPTEQDVFENAIEPLCRGMDADRLTVKVEWINGLTGDIEKWDSVSKTAVTKDESGNIINNRVRVTVTYQSLSELFFGAQLDLQSVSEIPMSF